MTFSMRPGDRFGGEGHPSPKKKKKKEKSLPPKPGPQLKKKWGGYVFKWFFILSIWGLFLGGCFVLWYGYDLPDITKLQQTERRPSLTILAKDGTRLATYGDLHGQMVEIKKLPPHVVQALLAIEDHRFYSHFGVDLFGLIRAFWVNYRAGHVVQGGSTITQQLAKNFLQSEKLYTVNDRSLRRKIQEALLALWLEHKFTKDQILTMYLNRVYLGSGTFGISAAAQHYFGKNPQDLTLYESAMIAGLLKAPSKYSPSNNPKLADQRAEQVLENMEREGFITEGAKIAALTLASSSAEKFKGSSLRYFTDWIVDILPSYVETRDRDLIITTTLDPQLQRLAEDKLQVVLEEKGKKANVSQLSLVSLSYDGAVRSLVGGVNYKKSQFNRATQALRQTGSTSKVIVYLAALELGMHPFDPISDLPVRIGRWRPKNYLYQSRGEISLQEALAYSVNTATVRLAQKVGLPKIIETTHKLGLTGPFPRDLSIVLGTGDSTLLKLTAAYAIIARKGMNVKPYGILKVTDRNGILLYSFRSPPSEQIFNPTTTESLTQMLQAVLSYGTGKKSALPGRFAAGKTGTSQDHRDSWFVGFTDTLVTGVWAGNDDNQPMDPKGGSPAARYWHLYMLETPHNSRGNPRVLQATPQPDSQPENSSGSLLEQLIDTLF